MDLEESAKQDLFDFEGLDTIHFYDPYRSSNFKAKNSAPHQSDNFLQSFDKNEITEPEEKAVLQNDRFTLKMMLERLDSI